MAALAAHAAVIQHQHGSSHLFHVHASGTQRRQNALEIGDAFTRQRKLERGLFGHAFRRGGGLFVGRFLGLLFRSADLAPSLCKALVLIWFSSISVMSSSPRSGFSFAILRTRFRLFSDKRLPSASVGATGFLHSNPCKIARRFAMPKNRFCYAFALRFGLNPGGEGTVIGLVFGFPGNKIYQLVHAHPRALAVVQQVVKFALDFSKAARSGGRFRRALFWLGFFGGAVTRNSNLKRRNQAEKCPIFTLLPKGQDRGADTRRCRLGDFRQAENGSDLGLRPCQTQSRRTSALKGGFCRRIRGLNWRYERPRICRL